MFGRTDFGSRIENLTLRTVEVSGDKRVGGLLGHNAGGVISSVTVEGTGDSVGGLVGANNSGRVSRSYSTSSVTGGNNVGGLVGENRTGGLVTDSYWDREASDVSGSAGGEGKITADMQREKTFANWEFTPGTGVWQIDEGRDYPDLQNNPRN